MGFLAAAALGTVAVITALLMINVRRSDLRTREPATDALAESDHMSSAPSGLPYGSVPPSAAGYIFESTGTTTWRSRYWS